MKKSLNFQTLKDSLKIILRWDFKNRFKVTLQSEVSFKMSFKWPNASNLLKRKKGSNRKYFLLFHLRSLLCSSVNKHSLPTILMIFPQPRIYLRTHSKIVHYSSCALAINIKIFNFKQSFVRKSNTILLPLITHLWSEFIACICLHCYSLVFIYLPSYLISCSYQLKKIFLQFIEILFLSIA